MALETRNVHPSEFDRDRWYNSDENIHPFWTCSSCTYVNDFYFLRCELCSSYRPSPFENALGQERPNVSPSDSEFNNVDFPEDERFDEANNSEESNEEMLSRENTLTDYDSTENGRGIINYAVSGVITGMFAVGGAFTGAFAGAIAGRITESGMVRGAGLGALAGAVLSLEALETIRRVVRRESLLDLQNAFIGHLEALAASQANRINDNLTYEQLLQIFGYGHNNPAGLTSSALSKLPKHVIHGCPPSSVSSDEANVCSICLMELCNGQEARSLPVCNHTFHVKCADLWLVRHAQCPMCRGVVKVN